MSISKNYSKLMIKWAKDLYPLCRSLTGSGTLKTLHYFKKIHKDLIIISFKSGTKVFDWRIPLEWKITDGFFQHIKTKKKFAEFKKNNLHLLGYSYPINKIIPKSKLIKYLHTLKKQPNLIPYVTSYYKKSWGFCISENEKKKLPNGDYKVFINSRLFKGKLNLGELIIKGKLKKEILISTYICHPSMANNELSGPVLSIALIDYLKKNFKKTKYTYRFLFLPETIGSIAYLSKNYKTMKKNIIAGFVLSCVGDERNFSLIESRLGNKLSDLAIESSISYKKNYKKYSFLHRGSDERQYCAPGIDLPVSVFCKTKFGEFEEYHTSADNFDLVTKKGLEQSFIIMSNIIYSFEKFLYPKTKYLAEPMLSKRAMYNTVSKKDLKNDDYLNLIAYCDGKHSIFEISLIINKPLDYVIMKMNNLKINKLIS
jgi:aminopeptidase-like protein